MNWFTGALKNYAGFSGRAHRTEYWMFVLFAFIIYVVLIVIDVVVGTAVLAMIFGLGILIPSLAIAARRLHDTNRSGWWQLIALVPAIGAIVLLVFLVLDSEEGENRFGPNPKEA